VCVDLAGHLEGPVARAVVDDDDLDVVVAELLEGRLQPLVAVTEA
jgi:hypothetical protein